MKYTVVPKPNETWRNLMVQIVGQGKIDLSFIASLHCNLECPHCQYDAGPKHKEKIDLKRLLAFMRTTYDSWENFNSFGFYGGEISADLNMWSLYISLINEIQKHQIYGARRFAKNKKPMWAITNGSWSQFDATFHEMVDFAYYHDLHVYISTTPYHKEHQNFRRLKLLVESSDHFQFKSDDTKKVLQPMGRNYNPDWYCTRRCQRIEATERLAIMPNMDVIYQKCDGVYPVVANISPDSVTWAGVTYMLANRLERACPVLNPLDSKDIGDPSWQIKILEREVTSPRKTRSKYLLA